MSFEAKFKKDVLARLDRAEAVIPGYTFKKLRASIENDGAVATAKRLLDLSSASIIQYGLDALAEADMLDCSIEQAAIDHETAGEFSIGHIAMAKARLKILRRKKARCDDPA